jgi:predicted exporter
LITGRDWPSVAEETEQLRARLDQARTEGFVESFESPSDWIPSLTRQRQNAQRLSQLNWETIRGSFRAAISNEGFRMDGFQPAFNWLDAVAIHSAEPGPILITPETWPKKQGESAMLLGRYAYVGTDVVQSASYVYPSRPLKSLPAIHELSARLGVDGKTVRLTNWDALIVAMQPLFRGDFIRITAVVFVAVVMLIWLDYRRIRPTALALLPLGGALLCVLAIMKLCRIQFNLANFFAVPIVIGAGVDYAIHVLNAFREPGAESSSVVRVTGKAIVLNALTTAIGFGSLLTTDHRGLSTLGLLTAAGILLCLIFSLATLPACLARRDR